MDNGQTALDNEHANHESLAFMAWVREAPMSELESQLRMKFISREDNTWEFKAIQREVERRNSVKVPK